MELTYLGIALVQSLGVSLGVGASTLAILNYIVASKDGSIDPSEQRLLRIVYIVLRISMGVILFTMFMQGLMSVAVFGANYFQPFTLFAWTVLIMLYVNAILMTKHRMPRAVGPALQVSSWYMLAVLYFMGSANLTGFQYTQFFIWYLCLIIVMMMLINGTLAFFKTRV